MVDNTQKLSLDDVLTVIENPIRRKILRALVKEKIYPLKLSKELRVSQQLISKHLQVLERHGFVKCTIEESTCAGPDRKCYALATHFSLIADLTANMFSTELFSFEESIEQELENIELIKKYKQVLLSLGAKKQRLAHALINEIDRELGRIEEQRLELLRLKGKILTEIMP